MLLEVMIFIDNDKEEEEDMVGKKYNNKETTTMKKFYSICKVIIGTNKFNTIRFNSKSITLTSCIEVR